MPAVAFAQPSIADPEIAEVVATLRSGWLSTGPRVRAFERRFAEYVGARHAIGLNSCSAGLHLSLLAAGIGPGHEVITTPLTFCATANAIVHCGATPVFADIDPTTLNIDAEAVDAAFTPRTRAVLPVHFAGRPVDPAVGAMARRCGVPVIEDAAHCIEGVSAGQKIGSTGDFTCFSFYATKNLTTGEGGMVTTDSDERAAWIRVASLHGMSHDAWARSGSSASQYDVVVAGYKYNMMDLQAAIGLHQLAGLEERLTHRERLWQRYEAGLADLPVVRPIATAPGDRHARHLYTILIDERATGWTRDGLRDALAVRGIATGVHFKAVHLHPFYANRYGFERGACPHAERASDQIVSLPFSAALSFEDVDWVVESIRSLLT